MIGHRADNPWGYRIPAPDRDFCRETNINVRTLENWRAHLIVDSGWPPYAHRLILSEEQEEELAHNHYHLLESWKSISSEEIEDAWTHFTQ
jgi:hypothetical protein